MECHHELGDMEAACADGLCPLCLQITINRLREENYKLRVIAGIELYRPRGVPNGMRGGET